MRLSAGRLTLRLATAALLSACAIVFAHPPPAAAASSGRPGITIDHVGALFGPNLRTARHVEPGAFSDLGATAVFNTSTFEPDFPIFAFNPPAGTGPRCSNPTGVGPQTRPMTGVAPNPDGTCQVLPARGTAVDGTTLEAGSGQLASFVAQFTAPIQVDGAGDVTFHVRATGAWALAIGDPIGGASANPVAPSYVTGPRVDLPGFTGVNPAIAARNRVGSDAPEDVTVHFPEAAGYTLVIAYSAGPGDPLVLVVDTGAVAARAAAFADSVPSPSDLSKSVTHIATNAAVAAGLGFAVAFPSELFDSTFEEHSDEITAWFRRQRDRFRRRRNRSATPAVPKRSAWRSLVVFAAVVAVSSLLYGLLDPGFGFDRASAVLFVGLVLALVGSTLVFSLPIVALMRARHRDWGRLDAVPAALPIAAGCVLLSRVAGFQPGYLYGAIVGIAFAAELSAAEEGQTVAVSALWTLAVSVVAWLARSPVHAAAVKPGAGFGMQALDAALASVVVIGIEGVVIGLLPMRFLDGARLKQWNRRVWIAVFGVALFAFVDILLNPKSGYIASSSRGAVVMTVAVFLGFGLGSLLFWAFFRFRFRPQPANPA